VIAVAAFVAVLAVAARGGLAVDIPWAPSLGIRLAFSVDGLAVLYGLLAAGIGALVFVFGWGYLPRHLAHEDRPMAEARRFWPWMIVFLIAMIGLASATDLVLLFLFFDVTAIASYFLIGFDRHRTAARGSALMALLRSRHRSHADAAVRVLQAAGRRAVGRVRPGEPAAAIAGFAEAGAVDLIVLGSRGRTGLRRTLLGSVARDVVSSTQASVLVVRGRR
jgi:nucleotide-binding universal stress UspA family protein